MAQQQVVAPWAVASRKVVASQPHVVQQPQLLVASRHVVVVALLTAIAQLVTA